MGKAIRRWLWWQSAASRKNDVYAFFDVRTHQQRIHRLHDWLLARACDWSGGNRSYPGHSGTDFILPVGTPVLSMAAGMVAGSYRDMRGGPTVFVDHGGGVATSYRHLESVCVALGQRVMRGERLGSSGRGGLIRLSAGLIPAHLHVTLWVDGLPTDPYRAEGESVGVGYWTKGNVPCPADIADARYDYAGDFVMISREALADQCQVAAPVAWANFESHFWRFVPAKLSRGTGAPRPKLSAPFPIALSSALS